jgi:hypothetical protein
MLVLYAVYFRTNPAMERYITHLIPFLLIPGGFGVATVINLKKHNFPYARVIIALFTGALFFQGISTWIGIRGWGDKSWFQISYDERAAEMTRNRIKSKDTLLLASFPEPYYYVSRLSTHSITDTPPHVYIPDSLNTKEIIISEDMGMRDIFPTFTKFLDKNMQDRKVDSFYVHLPYHYADYSRKGDKEVILYKTTVKELKERIKSIKE